MGPSGASPPETETVRIDLTDGGIAWVYLNRPRSANARNQRMRHELAATWRWVAAAEDVSVVVLTGEGDRHFCAGMDLKEAGAPEIPHERRTRMRRERDIELLAALPQPTVAAVNGAALGGGLEMALACDLRILATEAIVGLPEVGHGLIPGGGGTVRLPRLVGLETAYRMIYLGETFSGPQAVAVGLAHRHVPRLELHAATAELAEAIAARPPSATRAAKEAVRYGLEHTAQASTERELDALLWLMSERYAGMGQRTEREETP